MIARLLMREETAEMGVEIHRGRAVCLVDDSHRARPYATAAAPPQATIAQTTMLLPSRRRSRAEIRHGGTAMYTSEVFKRVVGVTCPAFMECGTTLR